MRNLLFLFLFLWGTFTTQGQSITINPTQVSWDSEPISMRGNIGEWTNSEYITLKNYSGINVRVQAHIHHHLSFIYFVDDKNKADNEINISMPPYSSYKLRVISKLTGGEPKIYNDKIGFDVYYSNNTTAYFEIDASVYFYGNTVLTPIRPAGYHFWGLNGYPRIVTANSPLKVYSNHRKMSVSDTWAILIKKAINTWNNAGQSIQLGRDFFQYTDNSFEADLEIDWSGSGLPPNALGVAKLSNSNPTYIMGITMRPPGSDNIGRTAEVLIQEVGHILGLEHSDYQDDLMNGQAHGHVHEDLSQVELTTRDRQMLYWLYSQTNYIPILSRK